MRGVGCRAPAVSERNGARRASGTKAGTLRNGRLPETAPQEPKSYIDTRRRHARPAGTALGVARQAHDGTRQVRIRGAIDLAQLGTPQRPDREEGEGADYESHARGQGAGDYPINRSIASPPASYSTSPQEAARVGRGIPCCRVGVVRAGRARRRRRRWARGWRARRRRRRAGWARRWQARWARRR